MFNVFTKRVHKLKQYTNLMKADESYTSFVVSLPVRKMRGRGGGAFSRGGACFKFRPIGGRVFEGEGGGGANSKIYGNYLKVSSLLQVRIFWIRNFFFPDTATFHMCPANPFSRVEKRNPQRIRLRVDEVVDGESGYFRIRWRCKIVDPVSYRTINQLWPRPSCSRVNPDTTEWVWTGELDLNICYVWSGKFLNTERKICGLKNIRIREDGALLN